MRKVTLLLSTLVLAAMVLAACGGGTTSTTVAPTQSMPTEASTATEMPTEMPVATETAGVPVTGSVNPSLVSNEMNFDVMDQSGNKIAKVNDMVLDLDTTSVAYVVVDTGGLLGVGGKKVAVPWNNLMIQAGTSTGTGMTGTATSAPTTGGSDTATSAPTEAATAAPTTSSSDTATSAPTEAATAAPTTGTGSTVIGEQSVFILQTDPSALNNAPDFDPAMLPQMGQSASGWDSAIVSYWQGVGTGTGSGSGTGSNTPAPQGTVVPDMTGVATGQAGTGTDMGTATSAPTESATMGTATSAPTTGGAMGTMALQGVALASNVIGATVNVSSTTGTGTGTTGTATSAPTTGGSDTATAAPTDSGVMGTATSAPATGGTSMGSTSGTVKDLIVDTASGDIQYVVVDMTMSDGEHLIPVPLSVFQWDGSTQALVINTSADMLQGAPSFQNGQFPDTSMPGWDSEFQSFWQNNGAGASATATP